MKTFKSDKKLLNLPLKSGLIIYLVFGLTFSSCKKFIAVEPPAYSINGGNVYEDDQTAIAAVTSIYTKLSNGSYGLTTVYPGGGISATLLLGLSADELTLYSGVTDNTQLAYYKNQLLSTKNQSAGPEFWTLIYSYLYVCNAAVEGMEKATSLTPHVKNQLVGEVKFLRAWFYFYLMNLYGDAPLVLSEDYKVNSTLSRAPQAQVYQQIITDLKDAEGLLSTNYLDATLTNPTSERIRPTQGTAAALLARVYLYAGDWVNAELQSSTVINNATSFSLTSLDGVFLKNSTEAIWQLQPVNTGKNTEDAPLFILPATGMSTTNPVCLSPFLMKTFETNDQRRIKWVNSVIIGADTFYYSYKYKIATLNAPVTEYPTILRLGEQYLIRAESRAQQNNLDGALKDLNAIRNRAGLANTTAADRTSLIASIMHERQVELFTEWGHRWLDLKRTGNVDVIMGVVTPFKTNGAGWQSYQRLYPLPLTDIQSNSSLSQNPGY